MQHLDQGSYRIEQDNNILLVDAQGPFSEVTSKQYQRDIEQYTQKMSVGPWGSLISFTGNGVVTPDAEQNLIDTTHYRIQNGMIAIAAVINDSTHAEIIQLQLQRIYQNCQVHFNFFSDVDNAKRWLDTFIEEHCQQVANN